MNEPVTTHQTSGSTPLPGTATPWAWPKGHWLGVFELQETVACSTCGIVYRAWDHGLAVPVAIKEYLPALLAARAADGRVAPLAIENAAVFERGLQAFIEETRELAQCDHPALVRMLHLLQLHGTAYRVMPWYAGRSLIEVRRGLAGPPTEASLRGLLDSLLGALEIYHRVGHVHGGLHPAQIMLLADDRALLLGPAAAQRALAGDTDQAAIDQGFAAAEQTAPSPAARQGPWTDFYALAQVARYWITGLMPPLLRPATVEPMADTVQQLFFDVPSARYSDSLLRTLDAALAPDVAERPQTVAHFRAALDGVPSEGVEEHESGEAQTLRLIQRAVASGPLAPTAARQPLMARPEAAAPAAASDWDAEITGVRDAPLRRRHALAAGSVVAALGLAVLLGWLWHEDPVALRADSISSLTPAAHAPASAAVAAAAPEVATAAVPEAPPVRASEPEAAPRANDRAESAVSIPEPPMNPRTLARAESATPRTLCGRRSEFSLYRCMQQQCSQPQWLQHPQCQRLKATDRVD